jgi:hypothetical protein
VTKDKKNETTVMATRATMHHRNCHHEEEQWQLLWMLIRFVAAPWVYWPTTDVPRCSGGCSSSWYSIYFLSIPPNFMLHSALIIVVV